MKKALKVTQSGKNGKSYFYVEKEVLQKDLTTKIVWVRISEQEGSEMLKNDHVVSDMTFKGDNMTTIYCVNLGTTSNAEVEKTEKVLNVATVESEVEAITNEIDSLNLMIHESKLANNSNAIIKYMTQQDALYTQLAELKHKQLVLNVKSA